MNDFEIKRAAVISAYEGDKWRKRVFQMSERQLTAVYLRLKSQGKI